MGEWISVNERLPNNNQRVLATNNNEIELCFYRGDNKRVNQYNDWYIGWFAGDSGGTFSSEPYSYDKYISNVTHWMPLPEPPKDFAV